MRRTTLLLLFFTACSVYLSPSSALSSDELSLVVGQFTTLQLSPSLRVEKSPGVKPGVAVLCARVQIHGLSRLRNLTKFAHFVKVNVSVAESSARLPNVEVCFHRNLSIGIGMCPQGQWEKLVKGSVHVSFRAQDLECTNCWFFLRNHLVINRRRVFPLSHCIFGLGHYYHDSGLFSEQVFGFLLYSSAMAVGIIFVILMVLFYGNFCTYWNLSIGIGMCPQGRWEKLVKGSWVRSMSPFEHKILDVRIAGSSSGIIQLSIEEEFFLYRIVFLVSGIIIMTVASSLSKSVVFYYSSAMTVGIILVILMVLFQGMKLLPTGRKNSVAIFVYSSIVGLGSFFLRYLPGLLRSVLVDLGISDDMYYPLATFLLLFLVLAGAWLGFWVVRKLVLTEEGLVDVGVSLFVAWSIRIIAAVMILQSSVDPLLAAEALLCGILGSSLLKRLTRSRFLLHLYKKLRRTEKSNRRYQFPDSAPLEDYYDENVSDIQKPDNFEFLKPQSRPFRMAGCRTPIKGLTKTPPPSQPSNSGVYYSSFHKTPERQKFSKDEWDKFTKESTKKALEELVSSPDFSKWAVANAERITLSPNSDGAVRPRRWLPWF